MTRAEELVRSLLRRHRRRIIWLIPDEIVWQCEMIKRVINSTNAQQGVALLGKERTTETTNNRVSAHWGGISTARGNKWFESNPQKTRHGYQVILSDSDNDDAPLTIHKKSHYTHLGPRSCERERKISWPVVLLMTQALPQESSTNHLNYDRRGGEAKSLEDLLLYYWSLVIKFRRTVVKAEKRR